MRISRFLALPMALLLALSAASRADDAPRLSKGDGPYLVMAYSFRGPESTARAEALVAELKQDHKLPAYLYEPAGRKMDEVQVYVGKCDSFREAFELTNRVKKLAAKSLADDPHRKGKGLSRAATVRNPLLENK